MTTDRARGTRLLNALLLGVVCAAGSVTTAQAPTIVAAIGNEQITLDDFRTLLQAIRAGNRTETTLQTLSAAGRERLLDTVVDRSILARAARDEGLADRPDVRFLMQQAANQVLAERYVQTHTARVATDDRALREFFQTHRADFVTRERVKVRHIVSATAAEADAVLAAIREGGDFATLARERSADSATRETGGDLGWVTRGVMVKPFEDVVFALAKGKVGGPVRTNIGFHVVMVDDVEEPALPAFEAIKSMVKERKVAAELERVRAAVRARHPVSVNHDAVRNFGR